MEPTLLLAVIAWNLASFSESEQDMLREKAVEQLPGDLTAQDVAFFLDIIDSFIVLKRRRFEGIDRLIMDYEVSVVEGDIALNVASVPLKP